MVRATVYLLLGAAIVGCGQSPAPATFQGQFLGTPGTEARVQAYYVTQSGALDELFCDTDTSQGKFQCLLPGDLELAELIATPQDGSPALHAFAESLTVTSEVALTPLTEMGYQLAQALIGQGVLPEYAAPSADLRLREAMGQGGTTELVFLPPPFQLPLSCSSAECQHAEMVDALNRTATHLGTDPFPLAQALAVDFLGLWRFDGRNEAGETIALGAGSLPSDTWLQLASYHSDLSLVAQVTPTLAGFDVLTPVIATMISTDVSISWSSAGPADYYLLQVGADPTCQGVAPVPVTGLSYTWPSLSASPSYVCLTAVQGSSQQTASNCPYSFDYRN